MASSPREDTINLTAAMNSLKEDTSKATSISNSTMANLLSNTRVEALILLNRVNIPLRTISTTKATNSPRNPVMMNRTGDTPPILPKIMAAILQQVATTTINSMEASIKATRPKANNTELKAVHQEPKAIAVSVLA